MSLHCNTDCLYELIFDLLTTDIDTSREIYDTEVEEEIEKFLKWLVEQYAQAKDKGNV